MSKEPLNRQRSARPSMVEALEDRALMSATLGSFSSQPPPTASTAVVLPAVQKAGSFSTPTASTGIIAILIGL